MPSFKEIKAQMQGNKGLIKQIRNRYIPSTVKMAALAQKEFTTRGLSLDNIDVALDNLLVIEYEIYLERQNRINTGFIELADEICTTDNYPIIRESIDHYKQGIIDGENPTHILNDIVKIITALADSNRQSRVSRAGSSLMEHLAYLLTKRGFIFREDFQREYRLGAGCIVDFFFPNINTYQNSPENCFSIACQTTSNDRFRLSLAQMPQIANTRNRACTAIGCSNFGKNLGPSSLTAKKLEEASGNNVKFVIIGSAIDERLEASNAVISYEQLFTELAHIKQLWD